MNWNLLQWSGFILALLFIGVPLAIYEIWTGKQPEAIIKWMDEKQQWIDGLCR